MSFPIIFLISGYTFYPGTNFLLVWGWIWELMYSRILMQVKVIKCVERYKQVNMHF